MTGLDLDSNSSKIKKRPMLPEIFKGPGSVSVHLPVTEGMAKRLKKTMKFLHWNWKNETLKHWNIFGEIHRRMFQLITKEHMSVEDGSADVLEWPLKPTYNAINNKNTLFYTFGKISAFFSFQLFIFFTISSIDPEKIVSKSIQCFVDTKVFQCIKPWNSTERQKRKSLK